MAQVGGTSSFAYMAVKPGGKRALGLKQAPNIPGLAQELRRENQMLVRSWELPAWLARGGSDLSLGDLGVLNEQLAQLLMRGVPLVEAIEVAADTVRGPARGKLVRIRELVSSGTSFSDACRQVGGFDPITIAVYRGAERTGDLGGAAAEMATSIRRRKGIGDKALTMVLYPIVVMTIALIATFFLLVYVVPMLSEGLRDVGVEMPAYSRLVMGLGVLLSENLVVSLLVIAGVLAGMLVGRRFVGAGVGWAMRRAPVIKDVVVAQESARFFSVMAALTHSGVNLADSLGIANEAVSHPKMRSQLERLRRRLVEGGLLRTLIDDVDTLPVATRRLLLAAERSGDMESAFATLSEDLATEVDRKSERALKVLEPLMIVAMFVMIGSIVMAIMLPMLTMELPG